MQFNISQLTNKNQTKVNEINVYSGSTFIYGLNNAIKNKRAKHIVQYADDITFKLTCAKYEAFKCRTQITIADKSIKEVCNNNTGTDDSFSWNPQVSKVINKIILDCTVLRRL